MSDTSYCSFYVGQKVVCVDAFDLGTDEIEVVEGEVYSIRWIGICHSPISGIEVGVKLNEVVRTPCAVHGPDMWFRATRFRPLTDISIFQAMLNTAPVTEPAT